MNFFLLTLAALGGASALVIERQTTPVCGTGLYSTAQCCATDVLGVADLDCATPPTTPANGTDFTAICSDIGQRARCCVLPILGQDVLCQDPPSL